MKTLTTLMSAGAPAAAVKIKTFSVGTSITKNDTHFFVERDQAVRLAKAFESEGSFFLIHGPRASGKTTLSLQISDDVDRDLFVVGQIRLGDLDLGENEKFQEMMRGLARNQNTSAAVQLAAKGFLDGNRRSVHPLIHLFRSDYGGKK